MNETTTPAALDTDAVEERNSRCEPATLDEFVGQSRLKATLQLMLVSAHKRRQTVEHLLFYGLPGLGKTTLAAITPALATSASAGASVTSNFDDPKSAHWYWGVGDGRPGTRITYFERTPGKERRAQMGAGQTHHVALATAGPGFAVDEDLASLGRALKLPPWLEENRRDIERVVKPIKVRNT
jgi:hypothetical protein